MSEKPDIPLPAVLNSEEISKEYSKAEFLIITLLNDPQKSEYFRRKAVKGVRSSFFYIVSLGENSLHDINADDNGAYTQTRNTSAMFYCNDKNVRTNGAGSKDVGKLYYKEKVSFNTYQKIYVSKEAVVILHRRYCKAKSFPLKSVVTISNPTDDPIIPYVAVLYQTDSAIKETTPVLCHSNSKKESRPYIRTSQEVLSRTKDIFKKRTSCKET